VHFNLTHLSFVSADRACARYRRIATLVLAICTCGPGSGLALDFALTGFGTAGFAIADQDLRYLRFIDNNGTFKTDSLVGLQVEARFNNAWGATIQGVGSASRTSDDAYEAKIRWAFLSYRPTNEWLIRVGRVRPPVLINTQNAEVGVTYDVARLPAEVYTLSPVYDFDGGAVTKTWTFDDAELALDAYWGKTQIRYRLPFQRSPTSTQVLQSIGFPTDRYVHEDVDLKGVILSHTSGSLLLRAGVHYARVKPQPAVPETFAPTPVPAPPPVGGVVYQPVNPRDRFDVTVMTLGAEWSLDSWRITGEYGQRISNDTTLGPASKSGYVTVARGFGNWTPYVTFARLRSDSEQRRLYEDLNATPVPLGVQGPPLSVPSDLHTVFADILTVYDQRSTMLGVSYSFSPTSKLKAEWMRTKVGLASAFVDGDVHHRSFNVFSVSYSMAF
jgi:hypothetical protein